MVNVCGDFDVKVDKQLTYCLTFHIKQRNWNSPTNKVQMLLVRPIASDDDVVLGGSSYLEDPRL
jgi:hypothetical protein